MKQLLGLLLILLLYGTAAAQAPYTGGSGGGFAHFRLELQDASTAEMAADFALLENSDPFALEVRLQNAPGNVEVEVFDVRGRQLISTTWLGSGNHRLEIPTPAQILLLRLRSGDQVIAHKVRFPHSPLE